MAITTGAYKVVMDATQFQRGASLSRNELRELRRVMKDTEDPAEALGYKLDSLARLHAKGAIDTARYQRAVEQYSKQLPEVKQAEAERAALESRAARIRESQVTAEQRAVESARELIKMKREGLLTEQQYAAELEKVKATMPKAVEAEKQRLAAMKETDREAQRGKDLTRQNETALERYNREVADAERLLKAGHISLQTFNREVARQRGALDSASRGQQQWHQSLGATVPRFGGMVSTLTAAPPLFVGVGLAAAAAGLGIMKAADAAGAFADKMSERFTYLDQYAKEARFLDISTESLAGLRQAAGEMAGITDGQLNNALKAMNRNIGMAVIGGGEAKTTLDKLGLSATELAQSGTEGALRMIADRLSQVDNNAQRSAMAAKLFEEEGARMVMMMSEGASGFDAYIHGAQRSGEALSAWELSAIESANDSLGRMYRSMDGLANVAAVSLAPAVTIVTEDITQMILGVNAGAANLKILGTTSVFVVGGLRDVANAMIAVATKGKLGDYDLFSLKKANEYFDRAQEMIAKQEEVAAKAEKEAEKNRKAEVENAAKLALDKQFEGELQSYELKIKAIEESDSAAQIAAVNAKAYSDEQKAQLAELIQREHDLWEAKKEREDAERKAQQEADRAKQKAEQDAKRQAEEIQRAIEATRTPQEELADRQKEYDEWLKKGNISLDDFLKLNTKARNEFAQPWKSGVEAVASGSLEAALLADEQRYKLANISAVAQADRDRGQAILAAAGGGPAPGTGTVGASPESTQLVLTNGLLQAILTALDGVTIVQSSDLSN